MSSVNNFINILNDSLNKEAFIKASLGNYNGSETELKNIYIKKILIKNEEKLNFTYRYKTKDIIKNYLKSDGLNLLNNLLDENEFRIANLFSTESDIIFELTKTKTWKLTENKPTNTILPTIQHDREKNRKLEINNKTYLYELNITDKNGIVLKNAQDKFKQINHYIEILSSLLKTLPDDKILQIADMGSGKGYLTFALYDYLNNTLNKKTIITGIEYRKDMVELCNTIAVKSLFENLKFIQSTIIDYNATNLDVLIALHACDTATDDAIAKGIKNNASLIVVAPCCHKQIRREIEKNKPKNDLDFLTKHGIFMERHAEMVTDGLRALILELNGYSTKVFEFIATEHTPKNVLIVGTKRKNTDPLYQQQIEMKIKESKQYFGITEHYLEKALNL